MLYAAFDLETTGLDPRRDRVCEAAVVRFRANGTVVDEYATLIDPQRRVGSSEYHGITDDDVINAPTFAEAWPDLLRMVGDCVVVAHNLKFEDKFLAAELARLGETMPPLVGLCSLVTCRSQLDGPSYSLQSLYRTATSEWIEDSHTALGDCRALATLTQWLLGSTPAQLHLQGPMPSSIDVSEHVPGRIVPRAVRLTRRNDGYLGAIARRFPASTNHLTDPDGEQSYIAALDEIIVDQRITGDEGWRMEQLARQAGFIQQRLVDEHRKAWERATRDLPLNEPDSLPKNTRLRLIQLAHDLGHPNLAEELALKDDDAQAPTSYLKGWRIGLDGTGPDIDELASLIVDNGGATAKRITATVRFVTASDPAVDSSQLQKAREFGIDILTAAEARARIDPAIRAAADAEQQRRDEEARWQAERQNRTAEADAYFRHRWRGTELPPAWDLEDDDSTTVATEDRDDGIEPLPARRWKDEAADIELPAGRALLAAWKSARKALESTLPIPPERAAELGETLRTEFDRYWATTSWPPSGLYDDLQQLEKLASQVRGRHYVDWIPALDEYRAAKQDGEALDLLLDVIDAAERGARVGGGPPAPAYTHRAAVIYRRRKDYDAEIAIIERWEAACPHEPRERGAAQVTLAERLTAARRLRHRAQQICQ